MIASPPGLVLLGICAGAVSGLLGVGGGILIIPALVYLAGMPQKTAQGTSLMLMLLPVGLLAVWKYWQRGEVNISAALWLAAGFVTGGYLGGLAVAGVPPLWLARIFGGLMILAGIKIMLWP